MKKERENMNQNNFLYDNEYGYFSNDGREYNIRIKNGQRTPSPWSHIMANEKFGTLVTSNGGGYTWYGNSRENKITSWSNDAISDLPSEMLLIKTGRGEYTATPLLLSQDYDITYGFGYAIYKTLYDNISQELTIFVPKDIPEKISILELKNENQMNKNVKIYYCIEPVLGAAREFSKKHMYSKKVGNCIELSNKYRENYSENTTYITSSERIISYTCEKSFFSNNEIKRETDGVCINPYVVMEVNVDLMPNEKKQIIFTIGEKKREKFGDVYNELENIKNYWNNILNIIQVKTPVESMNIIMNGWLIYQTLASRVFARTSFYQCGGAFGFRDQLQDMLGVIFVYPEMARKQILYHAAHQFKEGDVLHWWHPEKDNGIRSRYRDDLLWLPYVVCEYISITGDESILDEVVNYIEGKQLSEHDEEIYEETVKSEQQESIYLHCIKAIDISLNYGKHGLPKMGGGDWNDGMNNVRGESVWLGFFLYDILNKFSKVCEKRNDNYLKEKYEKEMIKLKKSLNRDGWDGRWYKRAFFEDGTALGSSQCEECKIDGISQSWSVISGAGDIAKAKMALDNLDNYLVDRENMIIKLLTPAFNDSNVEPGYIKGYIPGVRENGGQYTHGACCCGQFLKY